MNAEAKILLQALIQLNDNTGFSDRGFIEDDILSEIDFDKSKSTIILGISEILKEFLLSILKLKTQSLITNIEKVQIAFKSVNQHIELLAKFWIRFIKYEYCF
ncbi:MAG: hypothetical protein K8S14_10565 [Actinomycetia bacterium]|nr:hypothetical protein [Actinomycetes bacterium]